MSQRGANDDSREAGEIIDEPQRPSAPAHQSALSVSFSSFAAMADASVLPSGAATATTPTKLTDRPPPQQSQQARWKDSTSSRDDTSGGRFSYNFNGPRGQRGGLGIGGRGRSRGGPFVSRGGGDGFASRGEGGFASYRGEGYRGGGRIGHGRGGGRYQNNESQIGRGRSNTRGSGRFSSYPSRGGGYINSSKRRREEDDNAFSSDPSGSHFREQMQDDEDGSKRIRHNNLSIGSEGEIVQTNESVSSSPPQKSPTVGRSHDDHRASQERSAPSHQTRRLQSSEPPSDHFNYKVDSERQFRRGPGSGLPRWKLPDDQESQRSERSFRSEWDSTRAEHKSTSDWESKRAQKGGDWAHRLDGDKRPNWKDLEQDTADRYPTSHLVPTNKSDSRSNDEDSRPDVQNSRWNNDRVVDRGPPQQFDWSGERNFEKGSGQQSHSDRRDATGNFEHFADRRNESESELIHTRWAAERDVRSVQQPVRGSEMPVRRGSKQLSNRNDGDSGFGPGLQHQTVRRESETIAGQAHQLSRFSSEKLVGTETEGRASHWNTGFGFVAERHTSSRWNADTSADGGPGYQQSHFLNDRRRGSSPENQSLQRIGSDSVPEQRQFKLEGDRVPYGRNDTHNTSRWSKHDSQLPFSQRLDERRVLQSSSRTRNGPIEFADASSERKASPNYRRDTEEEAPRFGGELAMNAGKGYERPDRSQPSLDIGRGTSGTFHENESNLRADDSWRQREYARFSDLAVKSHEAVESREEYTKQDHESNHSDRPLVQKGSHRGGLYSISGDGRFHDSQGPLSQHGQPLEDLHYQDEDGHSPDRLISTRSVDDSEQRLNREFQTERGAEQTWDREPNFRQPWSQSDPLSSMQHHDQDNFSDSQPRFRPTDERSCQNESQSFDRTEKRSSVAPPTRQGHSNERANSPSSRQGHSNERARSPLLSARNRRFSSEEMTLSEYNPPVSEVDVRLPFGRGRGFRGRESSRGRGRFAGSGDYNVRSISSFARSGVEGGRFSSAQPPRNSIDDIGRGRGEFGRRSFFDSGRGRSQFARPAMGGRGRDLTPLSGGDNARGLGEFASRSELITGHFEQKCSDRSNAPRLTSDGSGQESIRHGISGGGSIDSTSGTPDEGGFKSDRREEAEQARGSYVRGGMEDGGHWRGRGRGRFVWSGPSNAGRGRAGTGVNDGGRGRLGFVRGGPDDGGRSYGVFGRTGPDEGGRGRTFFARVGPDDGGRGRHLFTRVGSDGGGRGHSIGIRGGPDEVGRGRTDFHREAGRGRGRLLRGRMGEFEREDFARGDFNEAGQGRVATRPSMEVDGGRGPSAYGESRGGYAGGRARFGRWGRGDSSAGRWAGFFPRDAHSLADQEKRKSPTVSMSFSMQASRSPAWAERRTSLGASSSHPSEKSPELQSHHEEFLGEESMIEESSNAEEFVIPSPTTRAEPHQTPTPPPTPPPEPSKPSALVSALTRLVDLEAQMEYAYAKHTKVIARRKLLRAQYEMLERLPVGVDAFQADLDNLIASLQKSAEESEAGESKQ